MRLATFVFCCCAFFLASCNGDGNNNDIRKNSTVNNSVEERRILVTPEELTPCIKKELKLNTKYDVANYEGLEVKYFHKIMDYSTDKSREKDD